MDDILKIYKSINSEIFFRKHPPIGIPLKEQDNKIEGLIRALDLIEEIFPERIKDFNEIKSSKIIIPL